MESSFQCSKKKKSPQERRPRQHSSAELLQLCRAAYRRRFARRPPATDLLQSTTTCPASRENGRVLTEPAGCLHLHLDNPFCCPPPSRALPGMSKQLCGGSRLALPPPLEDEHLLDEVLLRLGPQPSSLLRATAVCRPWQHSATDHGFLRRFHEHHGRPPLLGVFHNGYPNYYTDNFVRALAFTPVMDPPNCIPPQRFKLRVHDSQVLDCRNGRVLVQKLERERSGVIVCDPLTGQQHHLPAIPPGGSRHFNRAVLCAAGSDRGHIHGHCHSSPFKVVLLCMSSGYGHVSIYSSRTGVWGNVPIADPCDLYEQDTPATLIGNVLHWLCTGDVILQFNLDSQSLSVIQGPLTPDRVQRGAVLGQIMRADDGAIGFAVLEYPRLRVWQRNVNGHGKWVLQSSLKLYNILGVRATIWGNGTESIVGYSEDVDTVFILVDVHVYMLHLKSLEFKILDDGHRYYPFTSFYSPDSGAGSFRNH